MTRHAAGWPGRLLLVPSVVTFFGIAGRHVLDPLQAAKAQGIAFDTPLGETAFRAGLGGFPLACALYLLFCLCSRKRVLTGLAFAELVVCTVLAVRIGAMFADGADAPNLRLVLAEAVLAGLTGLGILLEGRKTRKRGEPV